MPKDKPTRWKEERRKRAWTLYQTGWKQTEWVWSYLKLADLANIACDHLTELAALVKNSKRRMQQRPGWIQAFVQDAGYEL